MITKIEIFNEKNSFTDHLVGFSMFVNKIDPTNKISDKLISVIDKRLDNLTDEEQLKLVDKLISLSKKGKVINIVTAFVFAFLKIFKVSEIDYYGIYYVFYTIVYFTLSRLGDKLGNKKHKLEKILASFRIKYDKIKEEHPEFTDQQIRKEIDIMDNMKKYNL